MYLITGAAGFIGFHTCEKLLKNNQKVYGIDNIDNYYDPNLKKKRLKILLKYKNFRFLKTDICNKKKINLIVKAGEEKVRVDIFINKNENDISRTRIKNLILNKKLKLNNKILIDPSKKISTGDVLDLTIPEPKKASLKPYKFKLDIIYEDEDLIVLNKPSGIVMHPGAGNLNNTIVNALMDRNQSSLSNIGDELRPGIVHRIDKNTSGLVVIAKNNQAHENLSNQFSEHSIKRIYQLLIWGKIRPSKGKIETLIARSSKNRQLMEVSISKGKKAITNYKTIEIFENKNTPTLSLLECRLETGRTHQIRVHMNYLGNSIVGDDKYNKKFKKIKNIDPLLEKNLINLNRQFLHAKTIGFIHPKKNKEMVFNSILPQELEIILKMLRKTRK
ncbi:RluA family pseudouridine synthase [Pelagibacterales bacterium SAG-MED07]|nr:RluA family pseudouridine synthase [Pelagibacterales bacterium SAG-MED07]